MSSLVAEPKNNVLAQNIKFQEWVAKVKAHNGYLDDREITMNEMFYLRNRFAQGCKAETIFL